MSSRAKREDESFEDYKKNLKKEGKLEKLRLKGRYFFLNVGNHQTYVKPKTKVSI